MTPPQGRLGDWRSQLILPDLDFGSSQPHFLPSPGLVIREGKGNYENSGAAGAPHGTRNKNLG